MSKQQITNLDLPANNFFSFIKNDLTPRSEEDFHYFYNSQSDIDANLASSSEFVKILDKMDKIELNSAIKRQENDHDFIEAVKQNKKKLVENILEIKPELINLKTSDGDNSLHNTLKGEGDLEMVKLLLQKNPELVTHSDKENLTPIKLIEKNGFNKKLLVSEIDQIKELLQKTEVEYIMTPRTEEAVFEWDHSEDFNPFTSEYIQTLEKYDEQKLQLVFEIHIPAHEYYFSNAVKQNKLELVENILKIKPNFINAKTSDGDSCLHMAIKGEGDFKMIEFLLQKNPLLVTYQDKENLTPIKHVEKYGFNKKLLVSEIAQIKELLQKTEVDHILAPRTEEAIMNYSNDDLEELLGSEKDISKHSES